MTPRPQDPKTPRPQDPSFAYSYLQQGNYRQAIEGFEEALAKDKPGQSSRRVDFAQNIAAAYLQLVDKTSAKAWLEKAKAWRIDHE